jgi:hypothetical protein
MVLAGLAAAAAAVILLLTGWSVHDALISNHGDWANAIRTLAAWTGDAGKIALGALIGAIGAWIVARMNRDEARETRFVADGRRLAAEFLRVTEDLAAAVSTQVARRHSGTKWLKSQLPVVGSDKEAYLLAVEIHLTTGRPETGDAAYDLWQATRFVMDEFGLTPKETDLVGVTKPIGNARYAAWQKANIVRAAARTHFINAVRVEFRLPLLGGEPSPHPDQEPPPISADD